MEKSINRRAKQTSGEKFAPIIVAVGAVIILVLFVYFVVLVVAPLLGYILLFIADFFNVGNSSPVETGVCDSRTMLGDC
jgi:hypothetical protein